MGIVHHASYLTYFEAGRVEYMRRRGVSYADWVGRGIHLPVVDIGLRYRRPARFDQRLVVLTWIDRLAPYSIRFTYSILDAVGYAAQDRDAHRLVEGHTRLTCVDGHGALIPIPAEITERLAGSEVHSRPDDQV